MKEPFIDEETAGEPSIPGVSTWCGYKHLEVLACHRQILQSGGEVR